MKDKITFSDLIKSFAEANGITQQKAEKLVRGIFDIVIEDLEKDGKASITSFGSFELKDVAERTGINPQTKEEITIPAHKKVSFKSFKALEASVNKPYADLEPKLLGESQKAEKKESISEEPEEEKIDLPPVSAERKETEAENLQEAFVREDEVESNDDPFEEVISPSDEYEEEPTPEPEKVEEPVKEERPRGEPEPLKKKERPVFSIVLVVLILIIVGLGSWHLFFRDSGTPPPKEKIVFNTPPKIEKPAEQKVIEPSKKVEAVAQKVQPNINERKEVVKTLTATEATTYTIGRNDWFWVTAGKVYGRPALWPLIFEANFSVDTNPDLIEVGKTVIVPEIESSISVLSKADYAKLAKATRLVSEAYGKAGKAERSAEYLRFAKKYERLSKN